MSRQFDAEAADFTLERIIDWGFDQYAEKISDISGAATKEMAIEVRRQQKHRSRACVGACVCVRVVLCVVFEEVCKQDCWCVETKNKAPVCTSKVKNSKRSGV